MLGSDSHHFRSAHELSTSIYQPGGWEASSSEGPKGRQKRFPEHLCLWKSDKNLDNDHDFGLVTTAMKKECLPGREPPCVPL